MKGAGSVLIMILCIACNNADDSINQFGDRDFKQDMREFVIGISQKAKQTNPDFVVIPQNGAELISSTGEEGGTSHADYLNAIDGNGQEDLFYGYDYDNVATPANVTAYLKSFLDISKNAGKTILVTDYCSSPANISASNANNTSGGYISYAAIERSLNVIPTGRPVNENNNAVTTLSQAHNFLYLINPENYISKAQFIDAVTATNYDAVIMDLFLEDEEFTAAEVEQLKNKANGGRRMVICYMSIGEAEDYRYYWNTSWNSNKPEWIAAENPDWPGNYKVQYWNEDWQGIVYENNDSYLSKITAAGFNGVYLDIVDAFEYFEE